MLTFSCLEELTAEGCTVYRRLLELGQKIFSFLDPNFSQNYFCNILSVKIGFQHICTLKGLSYEIDFKNVDEN